MDLQSGKLYRVIDLSFQLSWGDEQNRESNVVLDDILMFVDWTLTPKRNQITVQSAVHSNATYIADGGWLFEFRLRFLKGEKFCFTRLLVNDIEFGLKFRNLVMPNTDSLDWYVSQETAKEIWKLSKDRLSSCLQEVF